MDHGHTVPYDRDAARLTAPTITVWSAFGRLLFAALPLETAQQWVARGRGRCGDTAGHPLLFPEEDTHG